jgi:two-component system, cell cycle sensor histidine kinase and response regulator CckA
MRSFAMDAHKPEIDPAQISNSTIWLRSMPLLVLVISLCATVFMWRLIDNGFRQEARHDFKDKSFEIVFLINEVLRDHEQVLRGGVGLFNTNGNVTREQWRRYVSSQQFNRIHPGIVGFGYAAWLNPEDRKKQLRDIRAEGFSDYLIRPEGTRPFYTAITYLEPFTGFNRQALGYDMYSEATNRAAMDRTRTRGITSIASRINLDQEVAPQTPQGMVMYLPVYHQEMPTTTREERQAALKGFVFSPIRMKEFIYGTLGTLPSDIAFEIFDGELEQSAKLMFSSLASEKSALPADYRPDLTTTHKIDVYGRTWTINFKTLPSFAHEFHRASSRMALGAGILLSFLLAGITYTLQTTRDRAVALAQGMTKELRESEETVRLILDTAGEAIYGVDENCCFTFCNPAGLVLLGFQTEEEVLGKNMHLLLHDCDEAGVTNSCEKCTIRKVMTTSTGCHVVDAQFRRADGTTFPVEYWAMPKRKDGRVNGAVVSFLDIIDRKRNEAAMKEQAEQLQLEVTERREAQKALLHYQKQLELMNEALEERVADEVRTSRAKDQALIQQEKMASIGQLAAGVAHEINTPMAFITSNLNILSRYFDQIVREKAQENNPPQPTGKGSRKSLSMEQILTDGVDLIEESLEGAERVTKIVQDLKRFSRVDAPESELIDMTTCLESALTVARNELESVATIRCEYEPVPEVLCHPGQLNQLFLNLLVNARQAIVPPGEILLRSWCDDDSVYASVSDTGHGIPEEIRFRIFEPFFTTKMVGQGTGLGLSVSNEIVKNHNGTLRVESEVGVGTTFTVILPRTLEDAS